MVKVISLLLLVSSTVFASVDVADTDMVYRSINFIIFVGIIYYLIAGKVKALFSDRSASIEADLQKVQDRLKETKLAQQNALKKVEDAKKMAAEILATAKKENLLLNEKMTKQMEHDVKSLDVQHQSLLAFEQRTMVSSVVEEIMGDILSDSNIPLDDALITDIMLKKVA